MTTEKLVEKAGTEKVHGAPLGAEELAGAKAALGIDYPPFEIPAAILESWRAAGKRSGRAVNDRRQRRYADGVDARVDGPKPTPSHLLALSLETD